MEVPGQIYKFIEYQVIHGQPLWESLGIIVAKPIQSHGITAGWELVHFKLATSEKLFSNGLYFKVTLRGMWFYHYYLSHLVDSRPRFSP